MMRILFLLFLFIGCTSIEAEEQIEPLPEAPEEPEPIIEMPEPEVQRLNESKITELVFNLTNNERAKRDLPLLAHDQKLEDVANSQSTCLYENNILEHDSIECGILEHRYVDFNITNGGGENLFLIESDAIMTSEEAAAITIKGLMERPSHR